MKKALSLLVTALLLVSCITAVAVTGSAAGYVTEGLVANYEGYLMPDGATTWIDSTGNGNDIVNLPNDDHGHFANGAFYLNAISVDLPDAIDVLMGGNEFTVEMVLGEFASIGQSFNTFVNCPSDDFSLFRRVGTDQIEVKLNNVTGNTRPKVDGALGLLPNSTVTVTFKVGGSACVYVNGELLAETSCTMALVNTSGMFFGHNEESRQFAAEYKAMRFYNVALSAEQVMTNYEADKAPKEAPIQDPSEDPSEDPTVAPGTIGFDFTTNASSVGIDTSVTGASVVVFTNDDAIASGNTKWSINVLLDKGTNTDEYVVAQVAAGGGTGWTAPLAEGQILLAVHSDGQDQNVPGKEAALALVAGDVITVKGLAAGTITSILVGAVEEPHDEPSEAPSEQPSEAPSEQPSEASSEEPSSKPVTPVTADSGVVALAVISVLALAGAVVVKKVR